MVRGLENGDVFTFPGSPSLRVLDFVGTASPVRHLLVPGLN
jgi:hypothetical protein